MSAKTSFAFRRAHKILGLVVGLQFLFWTASGLFFTIYPIEKIRGDHLVHGSLPYELNAEQSLMDPAALAQGALELTLKPTPFGPVYEVRRGSGFETYHAVTGEKMTPWSEAEAIVLAQGFWKGEDNSTTADFVKTPPREAGASSSRWRIEYTGGVNAVLWLDPNRVAKPRVRTTNWRIFDVLWRFHIMDIAGDDRFDSWWLRIFAFLGLTTVLFGFALLIDRARRGVLLK